MSTSLDPLIGSEHPLRYGYPAPPVVTLCDLPSYASSLPYWLFGLISAWVYESNDMCCADRGQITVSFTVLPRRRTRILHRTRRSTLAASKKHWQINLFCTVAELHRSLSCSGMLLVVAFARCRGRRPSADAAGSSSAARFAVAADTRMAARRRRALLALADLGPVLTLAHAWESPPRGNTACLARSGADRC